MDSVNFVITLREEESSKRNLSSHGGIQTSTSRDIITQVRHWRLYVPAAST